MRSPSFWHSLRFAAEGIVYTVRTQRNARIHLAVFALVVSAGIVFRLSFVEWALVILVSGLVISMETMNSGIEALIDLVQPDHHPQAKVAKDMSAGAVLLAAITAILVGFLVFGPKIVRLWTTIGGLGNGGR